MTRIEFAPETTADFERILAHLSAHDVVDAAKRVQAIVAAIDVLESNPLIGRRVGANRELVIGSGAQGCLALYRYFAPMDTVLVLAIRHQREAGYV